MGIYSWLKVHAVKKFKKNANSTLKKAITDLYIYIYIMYLEYQWKLLCKEQEINTIKHNCRFSFLQKEKKRNHWNFNSSNAYNIQFLIIHKPIEKNNMGLIRSRLKNFYSVNKNKRFNINTGKAQQLQKHCI